MSKHKSRSSNKSRSSRKGKTSKRNTSSSKRVSSVETSNVKQNTYTTNSQNPVSKSNRTATSLPRTGNVNQQGVTTRNVSQGRRTVNTTPTINRQRISSRTASNTTISQKNTRRRSGQNPGLWFTKLALQAAICVLFYFAVYTIITDYSGQVYDFAYEIFGDVCVDPSSKEKVSVTISEGASLKEISTLLSEKGLIRNEYSFYIRSKLSTNDKRVIIPGTYTLKASDNYEDILNILTQNDNLE